MEFNTKKNIFQIFDQKLFELFFSIFLFAATMAYHGYGTVYDTGDMRFPCYICRCLQPSKKLWTVIDVGVCEKCMGQIWNLVKMMRKPYEKIVVRNATPQEEALMSTNKK